MGATYTRQSTYTDGDVIQASDTNNEFNQLLAAFAASTGHTHDGTTAEGGPITKLLGNTLTFGAGTAGTDIAVTFDGESNDGVLKWMEDEDYFEFSDDILIASTEKIQFRDTAIFLNSSTDGQLDIDADTEIEVTAPTVDINASTAVLVSNDLKLDSDAAILGFGADNDVTLTHVADTGLLVNSTRQLQFGDSGTYIHQSADGVLDLVSDTEIEINATTIDINGNADISGTLGVTGVVTANAGVVVDNITIDGTEIDLSSGDLTVDVAGDIILDADGADVLLKDAGTQYAALTNNSGNLIIKSGSTTMLTASGANATFAGNVTVDGNLDVTGTFDLSDSNFTNAGDIQLDSISGDGDTNTSIAFSGSDVITVTAGGDAQITFTNGGIVPSVDNDIDLGSSSKEFKDAFFDGTVTTDAIVVAGTIGHDDDTDLLTLADGVVTVAGEISVTTLDIGGTNVTSTAAELNILDGVTASATDINLIDGITNGTVIASKAIITDSNKDISGGRNITISGELDAATLDISGNADIDGTLEADAITVNGTALDEFISDTVGAMVGSNTETGVAVSYDDSDNTLDFVLGTAQTTIESLKNTSLAIGRDDDNLIKFSTDNQIIFEVSGGDNVIFKASGEIEASSLDISGDADIDGTLEADAITVNGTALNTVIAGVTVTNATTAAVATTVTISDNESTNEDNAIIFTSGGDVDGGNIGLESDGDLTYNPSTGRLTATQLSGTLQTAAQANVTSLGTLTTLTVDNVIINGSTIGHTGDTDLMTVASGVLTVAGEVDATSLDISGDADIDGTLEADAITVNGTALNTVIGNEATALAIALG